MEVVITDRCVGRGGGEQEQADGGGGSRGSNSLKGIICFGIMT